MRFLTVNMRVNGLLEPFPTTAFLKLIKCHYKHNKSSLLFYNKNNKSHIVVKTDAPSSPVIYIPLIDSYYLVFTLYVHLTCHQLAHLSHITPLVLVFYQSVWQRVEASMPPGLQHLVCSGCLYSGDILPSFFLSLHVFANCACYHAAKCKPTDQVRTVLSLLALSAKSAFWFKSCYSA